MAPVRSTRLVAGLAGVAAAALVAGLPGDATAATDASWGPVVDLAHGAHLSRPDVAVAGDGTETVVWRAGSSVTSRQKRPSGTWSAPKTLGHGTQPQVGVDGAGTVTALWVRHLPGWGPQVMTARRPAGGRWSRPRAVSAPVASQGNSAHGAFEPDLAVGHDGAVLVSWLSEADDSGASRVQARYRSPGGRWDAVKTLSPVEARTPVCAVGDDGRAVVVYTVFAHVFAARRTATGWVARRELGQHAEPPEVAMDDSGDITAVWSGLQGDGVFRPQAVTRPAGGTWSAPQTFDTAATQSPSWPAVGISSAGLSTVGWARADGQVVAADHPSTGSWSEPTVVAPAGDAVRSAPPALRVTVGRAGDALLSWTRVAAGQHRVEAAYRPGGGAWQPRRRVSPSGSDAAGAAAFVRAARSVAVWRGYDAGGTAHVQLRRLTP